MARKSKPRKKNLLLRHRRLFTVVFVCLLLAVGSYWLFWGRHSANSSTRAPASGNNKSGSTSSGTYVNLSPPTTQDKQASNDAKSAAASAAPTTTGSKKAVTVVVSSGSTTPVYAYVTGVFENGGTCTATATNSATSGTATNSSTGFENSSYTSCPPISLGLSSGTWSMVVSYSSPDAEGSSQPITMQVQ